MNAVVETRRDLVETEEKPPASDTKLSRSGSRSHSPFSSCGSLAELALGHLHLVPVQLVHVRDALGALHRQQDEARHRIRLEGGVRARDGARVNEPPAAELVDLISGERYVGGVDGWTLLRWVVFASDFLRIST